MSLYLVLGGPAVGKSSASRALAASFDRSIHLPVDDFREMVVSGLAQPTDGPWSEDLAEQVRLARRSALDAAAHYRAAGFVAVIDDFVDPHLLSEYAHLEGSAEAVKVILRPAEDVARIRNRERARSEEERNHIDGGISVVYQLLAEHSQHLAERGWTIVDNSDLSITETAAAIRATWPR